MRLFHQGLAPWIILTHEHERPGRRKLRELELAPPVRRELARMVLARLKVPCGAIRFVNASGVTSADERASIHRSAVAEGFRRIIIVSSPHARRAQRPSQRAIIFRCISEVPE